MDVICVKKISVIVPCYNEEGNIKLFYDEIKNVINDMNVKLELIFVDDGSKDDTLSIIKKITDDKDVKYISFSRNFGKEAAIMAGLKASTGDYVTIIDADLQEPPSLLPVMYKLIIDDGYDCVATKNSDKKGYSFFRKTFTLAFYKIIAKLSHTEMVLGANDYRLMTRQVVDAILEMKEYNRYSKGIFSFVGFKTKWIEFEIQERASGTTKWNFWKLFSYAIEGIVSFSTVPLTFSIFIGFFLCVIAFILLILIIIKMITSIPSNLLSLSCILCTLSGIQLICLGIVGEYLAKVHLEVKNRPVYIIKESNVSRK